MDKVLDRATKLLEYLGARASARKPIGFCSVCLFVCFLLLLPTDCLQKTHTCKLHMILKLGTYLNPKFVTSWWRHQISNNGKSKFNISKNFLLLNNTMDFYNLYVIGKVMNYPK